MSKQDRQGARTPADLERKYDFGKQFSNTDVSNAKLAAQLNQLSQSFAQYVANTNAALEALSGAQMIEVEAKGSNIVISDASNQKLRGLILYGRTTQNGTPTADKPIQLVSVGEGGNIVVTVTDGLNTKKLTAITPEGLCGIKVTSGGNYTDSGGNMWLCDEMDYKKGVYIQRIGYIESYSGQSVGSVYMSSTGALTTGATVIYKLSSPIETALSADEVSDFAELLTYYLNTTITNNAECFMKVVYVADLKAYIDNKTT